MHASTLTILLVSTLPFAVACEVPTSSAKELPRKPSTTAPATDVAHAREIPVTLRLTGTLRAGRESSLAADTSGRERGGR